jgi:hypothetical protein
VEIGRPYLAKDPAVWHRSTAKNMPITAAGRIRNTRDRNSKSATYSQFGMVTALRNSQELQDRQIFEKHLTRIGAYSKMAAGGKL